MIAQIIFPENREIEVEIPSNEVEIIEMPSGLTINVQSGVGPQGPIGPKGEHGDDYILTEEDKEEIAGMVDIPEVPVQDVRVGGASVVIDGVANIVVGNGIAITSGAVSINPATDARIKKGIGDYNAVVPPKQHQSTFYGLAKAAGDATQSASSNPVGQYTDDAKAAIRQMIGAPSLDDILDAPVQDVQVNRVSVLGQDGVANVPVITGQGQEGAVRIYNRGFTFTNDPFDNTKKVLAINIATSNGIKNGNSWWDPIVPIRQHESVFYGLAAAAGDITQKSSPNTVGTYTDEAKVAIRAMLGLDDQSIVDIVQTGLPAAEGVSF